MKEPKYCVVCGIKIRSSWKYCYKHRNYKSGQTKRGKSNWLMEKEQKWLRLTLIIGFFLFAAVLVFGEENIIYILVVFGIISYLIWLCSKKYKKWEFENEMKKAYQEHKRKNDFKENLKSLTGRERFEAIFKESRRGVKKK